MKKFILGLGLVLAVTTFSTSNCMNATNTAVSMLESVSSTSQAVDTYIQKIDEYLQNPNLIAVIGDSVGTLQELRGQFNSYKDQFEIMQAILLSGPDAVSFAQVQADYAEIVNLVIDIRKQFDEIERVLGEIVASL